MVLNRILWIQRLGFMSIRLWNKTQKSLRLIHNDKGSMLNNSMFKSCAISTAQKMKFSVKDFFSKCDPQEAADLVTSAVQILTENLIFCVLIDPKFISCITQPIN